MDSPSPATTRLSIIIPAHNEEAVIARCLTRLAEGARSQEFQVIVVCNGCSDRTAAVARDALQEATIVELPDADKIAALNAGDELATIFPRVYLDADVEVDAADLRRVAEALEEPRALCAAPVPHFVLDDRSWLIRKFYEAWSQLPYLNEAMIGSGFYALSGAGHARFTRFPDNLVADDQFVLRHFDPGERVTVAEASFRIHTPRTLRGLIAMRTRVYKGNRGLADTAATPIAQVSRRRALLRLFRPRSLAGLGVYVLVNGVASLRSYRQSSTWERDESARRPDHARGHGHRSEDAETPDPEAARRIGYVVSRYPSVSHTFVLREIQAARAAGLDVHTFSVKRARPEEVLSEIDRQEFDSTWSIRPRPASELVLPHLRLLRRHPLAWARILARAVGRGAPGVRGHLWQVFYFAEAVILADECRRRQVRHLHAHHANVAADLAWIAVELGEAIDGPGTWAWTLTFHGSAELSEVRRVNLPGKLAAAALVLCVADYTRAQLLPLLPPAAWTKLVVVHTGADLQRYWPGPRPVGGLRPVEILCVGRVDPVKGYPVLLEAMARLRDTGRSCHLRLVGGGPGTDDLLQQVHALGLEDQVHLLGALGQDELPALYRAADLFCLPSFTESLPVVLMEAMASGLAVVATAIAGIPELVKDGHSGLLVSPGRPDALAQALGRLIDDHDLRTAMGATGRKEVTSSFDALDCGMQAARLLANVQLARPTAR